MEVYVDQNLILLHVAESAKEAVLNQLSHTLFMQGFVKESFKEAVLLREKEYPTGLPFQDFGVAIPHTDVVHVINPAIACAILSEPVKFELMGSPEDEVSVNIVFMLAVKDPKGQVNVLENLMTMCQNSEAIRRVKNASSKKEVMDVLLEELKLEMAK